jgi:hypothetical protein
MHRLASCIREVGRKGRFVNKVKQKRGTGRQAKAAPVRAVAKAPAKNRAAKPRRPAARPRRRRATPIDLRPIVIRGDKVTAATRLMAETLPLAGYTNILADCPGKRRPHLIRGMRADHRPNLVCQGGYRYVLMDVVFPGEMNFPDIASRWQLFASAAEQAGGEFHVVVPRWVEGVGAGRDAVSKAAEAIGIRISHIWEI